MFQRREVKYSKGVVYFKTESDILLGVNIMFIVAWFP